MYRGRRPEPVTTGITVSQFHAEQDQSARRFGGRNIITAIDVDTGATIDSTPAA
jgi:hypothetical protein